MKINKIISIFTASIICCCFGLSTLPVSAVSTESNNEKYTLEELFAMSKEEFFDLKITDYFTGEYYYNTFCDYTLEIFDYYKEQYNESKMYLSANFVKSLKDEDENVIYTANITEMEIEELIGDTAECIITSPITIDTDSTTDNVRWGSRKIHVNFPEYESLFEDTTIVPEDKALEIAKCWYCISQIIPMQYNSVLYCGSEDDGFNVKDGDVNVDNTIDLYDVIWIASDLAGVFDFTEGQKVIGDVNADEECNLYDAVDIAKTLMP